MRAKIGLLFLGTFLLNWNPVLSQDEDCPPSLSASISIDASCQGGVIGLQFNFSSDEDADIWYSIYGQEFFLDDVEDGFLVNHANQGNTQVILSRIELDEDCNFSFNQSYTINNENPTLDLIQQSDPSCNENNGSITLQASGGNSPYQYNINGSTFNTSPVFNGLGVGSYTFGVRDASGCESSLVVVLEESDALSVRVGRQISPDCNADNGQIEIIVNNAKGAVSYSIDGVRFQSTPIFTNLSAGVYDIDVRDGAGCMVGLQVNLESKEEDITIESLDIQDAQCEANNGRVRILVSSSNPPHFYSIDNVNFRESNDFMDLGAGEYTLWIRDANGCTINTDFSIETSSDFSAEITVAEAPDCDESNGFIQIMLNGGKPPFTTQLNNGNPGEATFFEGLSAQVYTIKVSDQEGCEVVLDVDLKPDDKSYELAKIESVSKPVCLGDPFGLVGNQPPNSTGSWRAIPPRIQFSTETGSINQGVADVGGSFLLLWTLSYSDCLNFSTDSTRIEVLSSPVARDDGPFDVQEASIEMNVLGNDTQQGQSILQVISPPEQGMIELNSDNQIKYQKEERATGNDQFSYVLCRQECPELCDTAEVFLTFGGDPVCDLTDIPDTVFPGGITPNNDGHNDFLEFTIVDPATCPFNYVASELKIFNRWGDQLFRQAPYENKWDGTTKNGGRLPPGIYFYVLRIKLEEEFDRFGSVTILY